MATLVEKSQTYILYLQSRCIYSIQSHEHLPKTKENQLVYMKVILWQWLLNSINSVRGILKLHNSRYNLNSFQSQMIKS
jgi:hypothetical protein